MNELKIFQQMDKGIWVMSQVGGISVNGKVITDNEFNGYAACEAVNNTYGKGINPESVEKMKEVLEMIQRSVDPLSMAGIAIKEALTAAKL
jgi:hypothetical protein